MTLANMVAVPLIALWAMPAGLIGLVLMPFRLDWLAFIPMGWGVQAILWVARTTAALPAATFDVPHMPPWGLAATALGIAWLGLWRSPMRLLGVPLIALGLASPMLVRPPDLMVSADARLIAVRAHGEGYLQQMSGASKFTREAWLQYLAAAAPRTMPSEGSASDGAISCVKESCMLRPRPLAKAALLVRGALHPEGCAESSVIVSAEPARGLCPKPWPALVDRFTVWRYGAVAIWLNGRHAYVLTDRAYRGFRPWVPPPPVPRTH
jgi:competence protein ComEC